MNDSMKEEQVGFQARGDRLLDAQGRDFVMRGVNHGHAWFPERLHTALPAIAATGANTVRMVLATGGQWRRTPGPEITEILDACQAHDLVAVLEVHDGTGWPEKPEARPLSEMVDYWLSPDVFEALQGRADRAIVNLANEPFGNGVSPAFYVTENARAIRRMRAAGYHHCLMVDGANWGQDWERIMFHRAEEIAAADPLGNAVFSIHMYEHYGTEEQVVAYLDAFRGRLPLVVGEFAADHGAHGDVDELAILKHCTRNGQGYLGWSWKGNGTPLEGLDIALTWDGELSPWGKTLVESEFGLGAGRATTSTQVPVPAERGSGGPRSPGR